MKKKIMANPGKIIVIAGTDASGKETQSNMLVERLKHEGTSIEMMSFPRYETPTGMIVGGPYLGKPEIGKSYFPGGPVAVDPKVASLYYAADRRAALPEMREILALGTHLLLDRYVSANMGHQGGKIASLSEREAFWSFLEKLEYGLMELPRPDKTVFLYMPFRVGMQLREKRVLAADGHEVDPEHLRMAEEAYLQLVKRFGWSKVDCAPRGVLRTREDIGEEVYSVVREIL